MSVPEGAPRPAPGLGVVPSPENDVKAAENTKAKGVAPAKAEATGSERAEEPKEPARGSGFLAGLLGVALAISAVLLANEYQTNRRLEASLAELQQELQASTGTLEVYETRMNDMRSSVGTINDQLSSLGQQLGALQTLLAEPVEAPPAD